MPGDNKKSFLDWLVQGAQDARDAKIGAVGAGTVRQLYNEGKSEEAQEMARNLAVQQGTALVNFIPAGFAVNKGLPWVMTNMALPVLGGEVVNETTRKISDNKYNSFGDFVYNGSRLANVANGTFMETPLRFVTDMSNPAYWAPYGKALRHTIEGLQSLTNAYNNLPVKIKFTPRENFRYRNIGGDNTGVLDLLESSIVRPPSAKPIQETKGINLTKDFTVPFFGHKGKMVDAKSYLGKWFVGAEDVGNFYKPYRNQWGYTSKEPLTINDVTINRRIFPKLTNSPYIEWAPGKYTEYNTPLKILQKNGFLTPNTPDNGFRLYSGIPFKFSKTAISPNRSDYSIDYSRLTDEQWDKLYFESINRGDITTTQFLRDMHFKVKAPNTKAVDLNGNPVKLFHGEKNYPSYYDLRYLNLGPDRRGLGVYYSSTSPDIAKTYATYKGGVDGKVREVYYNIENPRIVDAEGRSFQSVLKHTDQFGRTSGMSTNDLVRKTYWQKTPEGFLQKSDKDGIIIKNVEDHAPGWKGSDAEAIADNYVTWNSTAVKSAETITRDNSGNIIPLSQRDNFKIGDLRYGLIPLGVSTTLIE